MPKFKEKKTGIIYNITTPTIVEKYREDKRYVEIKKNNSKNLGSEEENKNETQKLNWLLDLWVRRN